VMYWISNSLPKRVTIEDAICNLIVCCRELETNY